MLRPVPLVALCTVLAFTACKDAGPQGVVGAPSSEHAAVAVPLRKAPVWMDRYCHEAADDLGYAVICPRRLPRPLAIISCEGPDPKPPRWTPHCFDYVLDVLFTGPPDYHGPFRTAPRTGHLAMWVIGPDSQFNRQGQLVGCPGGGEQGSPDRLVGHPGSWWECPDSPSGANLNSGHVAFQWRVGGVAYGLSLHRITEINRGFLRQLSGTVTLVGPRA